MDKSNGNNHGIASMTLVELADALRTQIGALKSKLDAVETLMADQIPDSNADARSRSRRRGLRRRHGLSLTRKESHQLIVALMSEHGGRMRYGYLVQCMANSEEMKSRSSANFYRYLRTAKEDGIIERDGMEVRLAERQVQGVLQQPEREAE